MEWDHWPNQGYPCRYCKKLGHDEVDCPKEKKETMIPLTDTAKEILREELRKGFEDYRIPASVQHGLEQYVLDGRPTGGFLQAVLSNDLKMAVSRADLDNVSAIPRIVKMLFNHAPAACWGDEKNYREWIKK